MILAGGWERIIIIIIILDLDNYFSSFLFLYIMAFRGLFCSSVSTCCNNCTTSFYVEEQH